MNLAELLAEWDKDGVVDPADYRKTQEKTLELHSKYLREFATVMTSLKVLECEMRKLRLDKHEHYQHGPSKEHPKWKMPACGRITLKSDIPIYIDADEDVIVLNENITALETRKDCVKMIIDQIGKRQWSLNELMKHERFKAGER